MFRSNLSLKWWQTYSISGREGLGKVTSKGLSHHLYLANVSRFQSHFEIVTRRFDSEMTANSGAFFPWPKEAPVLSQSNMDLCGGGEDTLSLEQLGSRLHHRPRKALSFSDSDSPNPRAWRHTSSGSLLGRPQGSEEGGKVFLVHIVHRSETK